MHRYVFTNSIVVIIIVFIMDCMLVDVCVVCCSVIDVVFIVGSQSQSGWTQLRSFVNLIVDRFTISQYALYGAFVSYGSNANVVIRLNQYYDKELFKQHVSGINWPGNAVNMADALNALRNQVFVTNSGARSGTPWVAVVITDRVPDQTQNAVSAANQARAAGIQIIPVGVDQNQQLNSFLQQIAFAQARMTVVQQYSQLSGVAVQAANWVCNSHLS